METDVALTIHHPAPWAVSDEKMAYLRWRVFSEETRGNVGYVYEKEDADLFAEAGTVAAETGMTPRQLAEQRAELLEALNYCESWFVQHSPTSELITGDVAEPMLTCIRAAIAKATGGAA